MNTRLLDLAAKTAGQSVHPDIAALAESLKSRHRDVLAILAYGSALRDSNPKETLIDYYVITKSSAGLSTNVISRLFGMLVPPNVYYAENGTARCKYAVLPYDLLMRKLRATASNPYFWVRFAQPMRIVWSRDVHEQQKMFQALTQAMQTAQSNATALTPNGDVSEKWTRLFEQTYGTELRPEGAQRSKQIVDRQLLHYSSIQQAADIVVTSKQPWAIRKAIGKTLSLLRLLKAAFTFQGGADYAAWKIKRHSGVDIPITDWQRRHPILAAVMLLPKILKRGGLK
jgi:hypothetical protein